MSDRTPPVIATSCEFIHLHRGKSCGGRCKDCHNYWMTTVVNDTSKPSCNNTIVNGTIVAFSEYENNARWRCWKDPLGRVATIPKVGDVWDCWVDCDSGEWHPKDPHKDYDMYLAFSIVATAMCFLHPCCVCADIYLNNKWHSKEDTEVVTFYVGERVKVLNKFRSNNVKNKGLFMPGTVVQILHVDEEGDAIVGRPDWKYKHWVYKENLVNLGPLAPDEEFDDWAGYLARKQQEEEMNAPKKPTAKQAERQAVYNRRERWVPYDGMSGGAIQGSDESHFQPLSIVDVAEDEGHII